MPQVQVTVREGRTPEQIRSLITAVTDAVVDSVGAPKDTVSVVVNEVPGTHWASNDVTLDEKRAAQQS